MILTDLLFTGIFYLLTSTEPMTSQLSVRDLSVSFGTIVCWKE